MAKYEPIDPTDHVAILGPHDVSLRPPSVGC